MAHDRYRELDVLHRRVSYASVAKLVAFLNNGPQLPVHVYIYVKIKWIHVSLHDVISTIYLNTPCIASFVLYTKLNKSINLHT